mmetsp:Transcript_3519/g.5456  ORF Transcript_3519/g.5456 Transcript_3519/m.5456 type:complete len:250 (-) Transcript_3519:142-891(-)|eukprot:CAMPEP_0115084568 /NCGR_PEP_ID=MMETSP0227-20121206/21357_1 /TAXON_ID=89957 /ORGANISM="Polarella glacialis, Strain CCMP 1383" /LENGTH=249 /DNA_ID=CAMNT_0002473439 /DNA_START=77 /DNA_END=826 /DNA_ORIENTATION=-
MAPVSRLLSTSLVGILLAATLEDSSASSGHCSSPEGGRAAKPGGASGLELLQKKRSVVKAEPSKVDGEYELKVSAPTAGSGQGAVPNAPGVTTGKAETPETPENVSAKMLDMIPGLTAAMGSMPSMPGMSTAITITINVNNNSILSGNTNDGGIGTMASSPDTASGGGNGWKMPSMPGMPKFPGMSWNNGSAPNVTASSSSSQSGIKKGAAQVATPAGTDIKLEDPMNTQGGTDTKQEVPMNLAPVKNP